MVGSDSCAADQSGQPSGIIVTRAAQRLKGHMTTSQSPLGILFERHRADEARDRRVFRVAADGWRSAGINAAEPKNEAFSKASGLT